MADQADSLRALMDQQSNPAAQHRVITVASGKGGVGKSNFCVNFALELLKAGHRPVIVDADVGFADVEVLLGIRPKHSIVDVMNGLNIWEALEYHKSGLPFLSAGSGLLDIHDMSASQMDRILQQVKLLEEKYDVVIIDSGAGLSRNLSPLLEAADELIVLTTPEPTALADSYALLKLLTVRGHAPSCRLVVNRVQNFSEARITADKLRMVSNRFLDLELRVLGYLLEDDAVQSAVKQQDALCALYPQSSAARCFEQIVKNYLHGEAEAPKRGFVAFFEKILRRRNGGDVDSIHSA